MGLTVADLKKEHDFGCSRFLAVCFRTYKDTGAVNSIAERRRNTRVIRGVYEVKYF
jgi:hypothetical protein